MRSSIWTIYQGQAAHSYPPLVGNDYRTGVEFDIPGKNAPDDVSGVIWVRAF